MSDRLAGLVARGAAKQSRALTAEGAGFDPLAGMSGPKRAIIAAASELLAAVGGADVPWKLRPLVGVLQSTHPLLVSSVAGMDDAAVAGMLANLRGRIDAALADDPAPVVIDADA